MQHHGLALSKSSTSREIDSVRPGDGFSATVKELQALINAVDFCLEVRHISAGRRLRTDFPILNEMPERDLGNLRGKLVRERIRIDPEFQERLGYKPAAAVEKSKLEQAGVQNEAKT